MSNIIKIEEVPEATLLTRKQVTEILKIGLSTLDSLIKEDELPRVRIGKHVYVARQDLEIYINKHRSTSAKHGN